MSASRSTRTGLRMGGFVVGTLLWCAVTLWLGVVGLWKVLWFLTHVRQVFSRTLHCPRGHAVDAFGPLRCGRCHAAFEAHVFDPCPACGAKVRFIACPRCGLAVRNLLA